MSMAPHEHGSSALMRRQFLKVYADRASSAAHSKCASSQHLRVTLPDVLIDRASAKCSEARVAAGKSGVLDNIDDDAPWWSGDVGTRVFGSFDRDKSRTASNHLTAKRSSARIRILRKYAKIKVIALKEAAAVARYRSKKKQRDDNYPYSDPLALFGRIASHERRGRENAESSSYRSKESNRSTVFHYDEPCPHPNAPSFTRSVLYDSQATRERAARLTSFKNS